MSRIEEVVRPFPGMVITEDVVFEPGEYRFKQGQGVTVQASSVTIDGNGAILIGPGSQSKGIKSYLGTGVFSTGTTECTIKNLRIRGFQRGVHLRSVSRWSVLNNDLSGNYHDPEFGWGDGPTFGALLCEYVTDSLIEGNVGRNNWNGLDLRYSNANIVRENDFSHCSNVCLRMWAACENEIAGNDFSYGIRISPGEVHARDSSSMLMETGSSGNRILRNDLRHGGDGVFIRVLNGWTSVDNCFEGNDCSYANNNAVECWSPGNTFIGNKANCSSYGFWLGGSDHSVLIGNEVRYNGGYFPESAANAPEPFGNAGIAVVNGSGNHIKLLENDIQFNNGPGVAIGFRPDDPSYHWIIQDNRICNNADDPRGYRGHGIYLKNARRLDIIANDLSGNAGEPVFLDDHTTQVNVKPATQAGAAPKAEATFSGYPVHTGEQVVFNARGNQDPRDLPLAYQWEFGDGSSSTDPSPVHTYSQMGLHRVGLTISNGVRSDLAALDVYVLPKGRQFGFELDKWKLSADSPGARLALDATESISGHPSLFLQGEQDTDHLLEYPISKDLGQAVSSAAVFSAWIKFCQEPYSRKDHLRPVIRLHHSEADFLKFTPKSSFFLERLLSPRASQRDGWMQIWLPLDGMTSDWDREVSGDPALVRWIDIDVGPNSPGKCCLWLDAIQWLE